MSENGTQIRWRNWYDEKPDSYYEVMRYDAGNVTLVDTRDKEWNRFSMWMPRSEWLDLMTAVPGSPPSFLRIEEDA